MDGAFLEEGEEKGGGDCAFEAVSKRLEGRQLVYTGFELFGSTCPSSDERLEESKEAESEKGAERGDLAGTGGGSRRLGLGSLSRRSGVLGLLRLLGLLRGLRLLGGFGLLGGLRLLGGLGLLRRLGHLGVASGLLDGDGDGARAVSDGDSAGLRDGDGSVVVGDLGGVRAVGGVAGDDGGGVVDVLGGGRLGRRRRVRRVGVLGGRRVRGVLRGRVGLGAGHRGRRRRSVLRGRLGVGRGRGLVFRGRRVVLEASGGNDTDEGGEGDSTHLGWW